MNKRKHLDRSLKKQKVYRVNNTSEEKTNVRKNTKDQNWYSKLCKENI